MRFAENLPRTPESSSRSRDELREAALRLTTQGSAQPGFAHPLSFPPLSLVYLEKQGTCPSVDFPKLGLCEDQCQMDSQCSGNMKCCRNGCGKMGCTTPKF